MTSTRVRILTRGEATLTDLQQALDSLGVLEGDQFVICKQATLLDGTKARARRSDPSTSHEAAAKLTPETLREDHRRVLYVLRRHGPMIDEALIDTFTSVFGDTPESGLRTRRRELADVGLVVDTGEKRKNSNGNNAVVWAAGGGGDAPDEG